MSVRVSSADFSKAFAKSDEAERRVKAMVSIRVREDCKPYVPYVSGALRGSAETESEPERGLVIWGSASVPYAAAQYYGLPGKTYPGTCTEWFEAAKAAHGLSWAETTAAEAAKEVFG